MNKNTKPENRSWLRENAKNLGWLTATKNDRMMAGQNDEKGHRSVLMILSCHDSVCLLRSSLCVLCVLLWQSALAGVHYVDVNSTNATPPYTNWTTAATNIQDAVGAAAAGDEVVVTNGTYYEVVAVGPSLSLRSINGPHVTVIDSIYYPSDHACVYLAMGASLSGFTVTGGWNSVDGYSAGVFGDPVAGTYDCTVNNCAIINNFSEAGFGGGAAFCRLNNCTVTHNSAGRGGGAYTCMLNNCTVTHNSGVAVWSCILTNWIVYFNTNGGNYSVSAPSSTINWCTTPLPVGPDVVGCITNSPLFVDTNGWSKLRLQPNSPCINAGNNSYVTSATDLDGNPRISGGTVDIGAYEFQWPQLTLTPSGPNVLLRWPTNNAGYDYSGFTLQSTTNLVSPVVWSTNSPAPVVIAGQNTVTNPITAAQQFYRLSQ